MSADFVSGDSPTAAIAHNVAFFVVSNVAVSRRPRV
jgi:hypothetical protein